MAEESGQTATVSSRLKGYLKEAPFFCKIIELLLCVIAIGLIVDPFNNRMQSDLNHAGVIYIALGGFIMIETILILCYLLGEKLGKITATTFSELGAILCFAAGVILIYDWSNFQNNYISRYQEQYLRQMLASGIFAIFAAAVFTIETIYVKKYE